MTAEVLPYPGRIDLGKPQKPFGFYPSSILDQPKPPSWLVDGIIMRGTVAVIAGGKAVGKSLLMQQMFTAAALGLPFLGRHTERVRSFAYFCEDAQPRLEARQYEICGHLGVTIPDLKDYFSWEERSTQECRLVDFPTNSLVPKYTADWGRLWSWVEDNGIELVGIDTARAIFNGNENDPRQVTPFIRELQARAITMNGAVIVNAHPAKGGRGPAGTGAWHNSARAGWDFQRSPEYDEITNTPPNERVMYDIGSNYTGRSKIRFRWENGVFVDDEDRHPPPRTNCTQTREVMDREMLNGLYRTRTNGGTVPADWNKPGSMQRRYRATFDARAAWNDLNASVDRLLAAREVIRVRVGAECCVRPRDGLPYPGEEKWEI